jgi:sensor histidine kinase YesM
MTSNQEKEQLLATAELDLLKAQMRPHFIYNVLNDIKSMAKLENSQQIVKLL